MIEYKNFPPYLNFIRLLKSAANTATLYIELWRMRDKKNQVKITKKEVRNQLLCSPTLLRNKLLTLIDYGFVSVDETKENFTIRLFEPKASEDTIQDIHYL